MENWRAEALVMQELLKYGTIRTVVGENTKVGENFQPFQLHVTRAHLNDTRFKIKGMPDIVVNKTLSKYWTPRGQYSVVECELVTSDPTKFVNKTDLEGAEFKIIK